LPWIVEIGILTGMGAIVSTDGQADRVETFIARWQGREGGQERANYGLFLTELCETLALPRPDPADASPETNDYVFERVVKEPARGGEISSRRIDLYKRGCFVLEAKQSRWKGGDKDKEVAGQTDLFASEGTPLGRRGAERSWDVLMLNARQQAENYVRLLPSGRKRVAKAVQARGLKFQGISASMSLLGQRLAMRSNVSLAQA
jgi:hypothetical protein